MSDHGNLQKHLNANKVQQFLIDRVQQRIVDFMWQTVVSHLLNFSLGLCELLRVPSRYVLISVPDELFFRGANFLRGKHLSYWGNDPEHLHNYSGRAFRQLVSSQATVIAHRFTFPWQIILAEKEK